MHHFVDYYQKSARESCSEEELIEAGRDLLRYLLAHQGDQSALDEPEFVCCLEISGRPNTGSEEEKISRAFSEKTGEDWEKSKYHAIYVPNQRFGGLLDHVIFKKV